MKKLFKIKVWLPILLVGIGLIIVNSTQQISRKEVTSYKHELPPKVGEERKREVPPAPPPAPSLEINISTLGVIATILGTILGILRAIIEIIKLFKKSPAVPAGP
jgi:hypothetical protein